MLYLDVDAVLVWQLGHVLAMSLYIFGGRNG